MSKKESIRHHIDLSELLEKVPNRFLLTVGAAKRARQLDNGAIPLIEAALDANRSLDIALLEIQTGKILVSLEDSTEEASIIDDIADYLDSDVLDQPFIPDPNASVSDGKKKPNLTRKS